jgi:hypothetical protein
MGYTTRPGTEITDFQPDDTDTVMYINSECGLTLAELQEKINEKWTGCRFKNIRISSEKIHTRCLYYDGHDAGDWDNFIVIYYNGSA